MKADLTRWTFDPNKRFTRVLMQQGRVQLDADWNEQAAILLHALRTLTEDLTGPFGGTPANAGGLLGSDFQLDDKDEQGGGLQKNEVRIAPGRFYAGGLRVESDKSEIRRVESGGRHLLYLDVWERLVTHVQDDEIREAALGGVDTAARAKVVYRVRSGPFQGGATPTRKEVRREWFRFLEAQHPPSRGLLKAQAQTKNPASDDPCIASPAARFTGENQLYRVEIHKGGTAAAGAAFKWSRENGSVVFPISNLPNLTLEHLGRDGRFSLQKDDLVEALDDVSELLDVPRPLLKVLSVDPDRSRVTLQGTMGALNPEDHPYLRRWDHRERATGSLSDGAVPIQEGRTVELEDGIQITFEPAATGQPAHIYRPGDYWLIPARTATGDVEWPGLPDDPAAVPPHGVDHHYAPLGLVTVAANGTVTLGADCRTVFKAWI